MKLVSQKVVSVTIKRGNVPYELGLGFLRISNDFNGNPCWIIHRYELAKLLTKMAGDGWLLEDIYSHPYDKPSFWEKFKKMVEMSHFKGYKPGGYVVEADGSKTFEYFVTQSYSIEGTAERIANNVMDLRHA